MESRCCSPARFTMWGIAGGSERSLSSELLPRNNLFHTKTMSPLAVTYNDKSVLENMHVSEAFRVMLKDTLCLSA